MNHPENPIILDLRLICSGLACLLLGMLVYLGDRPPGTIPFRLILDLLVYHGDPGNWFGAAGRWLPTFTHVMAWSLIAAGVLSLRSTKALGAVCFLMLVMNWGFELGQLFKPAINDLLEILPFSAPLAGLADWVTRYFIQGTFDWADMAAAVAGAGLAFIALVKYTAKHGIGFPAVAGGERKEV